MNWNNSTKHVCVDTETTGVDKTDLPYAVSLCDDDGNNLWYQWDVDPFTRIPKVKRSDIRDIKKRCKGKILVFHNQNFDTEMLARVDCELDWRGKSHDVMNYSHAIDSAAHVELQGRLKELSLVHLDFEDDDQFELREATIKSRAFRS